MIKNNIIVVLAFLGLAACDSSQKTVTEISMCTVKKTDTGAKIICADGTTADVNNGTNGYSIPGQAGKSCSVVQTQNGAMISCQDGTSANVNNGLIGPQGSPGPQGASGGNCSVSSVPASSPAPNGGSLISCPDGSNSLVLNGSNGSNGQNGQNGTIVTSIQFCHGTPSYPSTFPEVGFCIGNQLYAVYSQNGGFMSLIPPGTYSSNGINSSCTFQVLPNCQIQN